jgi:hypothetical protein
MSDDTTKITATLPNDVVDGLRQLAEDKHLNAHCGAPAGHHHLKVHQC